MLCVGLRHLYSLDCYIDCITCYIGSTFGSFWRILIQGIKKQVYLLMKLEIVLNESPVHIFSFYLKAHVVCVDLCENRVHICVHQLK